MKKIKIDNNFYEVVENLGFENGYFAKVIKTNDGEKVVVKRNGIWTWWTIKDKLQPRGPYIGM